MLTGDELNAPSSFLVFLNGLIIGAHSRPDDFAARVRDALSLKLQCVSILNTNVMLPFCSYYL